MYPAEVIVVESEELIALRCMKKDLEKESIWVWPKQEDKVVHYQMRDCLVAESPKMYGPMRVRTLKYYVTELTEELGNTDLKKLCPNTRFDFYSTVSVMDFTLLYQSIYMYIRN